MVNIMGIPLGVIGTVAAANSNQGDPHWNDVVILMNFANSTTTTDILNDASGNTTDITYTGSGVTIENSAPPNVNYNRYYQGDSVSYPAITISDETNWQFPGEFTIEFWLLMNSGGVSTTAGYFGKCSTFNSAANTSFVFGLDTTFKFQMGVGTTLYSLNTGRDRNSGSGVGIGYGTWNFWAITRDSSGYVRIYLNGSLLVKSPEPWIGTNNLLSGTPFRLMRRTATGGTGGRITEFRITNGFARYTTDTTFPVPTEPFKTS